MEDGEIVDWVLNRASETPRAPQDVVKRKPSSPDSLRLVVRRTSILPVMHKLAIADGYSELQLGRDAPLAGTVTPKVRLKEMEVSKLHATVYWDTQRLEWSVVDMGSKHGTFLKSGASTTSSPSQDDIGLRLSPPRMASVPKRLHHLDLLTLASTTFVVHIHDDKLPCEACSPAGGDEIPLFHSNGTTQTNASKRSRETAGLESSSHILKLDRDPKKALTMLKHNLLSRHEEDLSSRSQSPFDNSPQYVDRSARRRALHPSSHSDSPGVQSAPFHTQPSTRLSSPGPTLEVQRPPPPEPVSQPATPLPSSNIGHRLLMKHGWTPGTALGAPDRDADKNRIGLVEPLEISPTANRAGLGSREVKAMHSHDSASGDWRERGLYQRWRSIEHDGAG
ncbi:hypothetical protein AX15_005314 [Amanita polypyramis BW_CC]|nr:hypothetical protein AX15_005314 [Amanita polypyramis BW_CC]